MKKKQTVWRAGKDKRPRRNSFQLCIRLVEKLSKIEKNQCNLYFFRYSLESNHYLMQEFFLYCALDYEHFLLFGDVLRTRKRIKTIKKIDVSALRETLRTAGTAHSSVTRSLINLIDKKLSVPFLRYGNETMNNGFTSSSIFCDQSLRLWIDYLDGKLSFTNGTSTPQATQLWDWMIR